MQREVEEKISGENFSQYKFELWMAFSNSMFSTFSSKQTLGMPV